MSVSKCVNVCVCVCVLKVYMLQAGFQTFERHPIGLEFKLDRQI